MDGLRERIPQATHSRLAGDGSLSSTAKRKTKNGTVSDDQLMAQSTPALPSLAEGKTASGEFEVSNRQRWKKSGSANTPAMSSNAELPPSQGMINDV